MALSPGVRDLNAALLQLNPAGDLAANLAEAVRGVERALGGGAELIVLPEGFAGVSAPVPEGPAAWARPPAQADQSPAIAPLLAQSRHSDALLVLGGVSERAGPSKAYNSALVLHRGRIVARYRKMHRFDADLASGSLRESAVVEPGPAPCLVDWGGTRIGLSICYDLRFPEFYRALASHRADIMLVPSAFTAATGRAHWHTLLRARAIENQAFVLAPALVGLHRPGRESFGHTLAVDPWGEVIAELPQDRGVLAVSLKAATLEGVRRTLPALDHRVIACETPVEVTTLTPGDAFPS